MNEKEFGNKIAQVLQTSLTDIDESTLAKLKGARLTALARYQEAPMTSLVWAGPLSGRFASLFSQRSLLWAPFVAALLALGVSGYLQFWQNEGDDVDAFLLSGDLPVRAYIDQDFDAWLRSHSR